MDTSKLAEVREAALSINRRVAMGDIPPIRVLILNAGYVEFEDQTWVDGFDTSFASTYLGHWLFALMLLQSMNRETGRIVVIGSSAHEHVLPPLPMQTPGDMKLMRSLDHLLQHTGPT